MWEGINQQLKEAPGGEVVISSYAHLRAQYWEG